MNWVAAYHRGIDSVLSFTGWPDKLVHVHAGLAIYLVTRLLAPARRGPVIALGVVIVAEAFNETMDRLFSGSWHWPDTRGDIAATLFWPILLVLAGWWRHSREERPFDAATAEPLAAAPVQAAAASS